MIFLPSGLICIYICLTFSCWIKAKSRPTQSQGHTHTHVDFVLECLCALNSRLTWKSLNYDQTVYCENIDNKWWKLVLVNKWWCQGCKFGLFCLCVCVCVWGEYLAGGRWAIALGPRLEPPPNPGTLRALPGLQLPLWLWRGPFWKKRETKTKKSTKVCAGRSKPRLQLK